jgi:hypothetical protein
MSSMTGEGEKERREMHNEKNCGFARIEREKENKEKRRIS